MRRVVAASLRHVRQRKWEENSSVYPQGWFHLENSRNLKCHLCASMDRGGRNGAFHCQVEEHPDLSPSLPRLWSCKRSAYCTQLMCRGAMGAWREAVPRSSSAFSHLARFRAACRVRRGLASTGSLLTCSNQSAYLSLKAEAFSKMRPLLEVTPQAISDSRHHSLEVVEQFLEQVHDKSVSTPIYPAPLLDPMISSLFKMIQP